MKILHKTSFRNISHTFPVCAIFLILRTRCNYTKKLAMSENQQQQQNIKGHVDDTKPEGPSEHVNLKVTGQDGSVVHFKIKKNTALRKLMSAYCERTGTKMGSLRFMFDGQVIGEGDSPSLLDMEDGDTIDVFQQQTGGMCRK